MLWQTTRDPVSNKVENKDKLFKLFSDLTFMSALMDIDTHSVGRDMYAFPFDEVILLVGIYLKGLKTGTGTIN